MALNAPDFYAGSLYASKGARALLEYAGWMRRRCNEITNEPALDLIKVYDLVKLCNDFRVEANKWIDAGEVTKVLDALVDYTIQETNITKTPTELNDDYKSLYAATGVFLVWAAANIVGQGQTIPQTVTVTINKPIIQGWAGSITIDKPAALQAQVDLLLAVYA